MPRWREAGTATPPSTTPAGTPPRSRLPARRPSSRPSAQAAHDRPTRHDRDSVPALVDQLARGDRSTALALHALISAADDDGVADFDDVAVGYRDDHLAALRATGRDAEREAGR